MTSSELTDKVSGLIVGAVASTSLSAEEQNFFGQYPVAGVTLFGRNIPKQFVDLRKLCGDLQNSSAIAGDPPLIIAIDQEGGRVRRIKAPFPDIGPNLAAFASSQAGEQASQASNCSERRQLANNYGLVSALSLSGIGVNVNFAPVVDIYIQGADGSIGDRCYSADPEEITQLAEAYIHGLHNGGVASCLKHFPGQGRGTADTHHEGTVIPASAAELEDDLLPFAKLVHQAPLVMVSHAHYPAWDPDNKASCSPAIIEGLLRDRLGFGGVVLSDDVNMKAFDQSPELYDENIIASIKAGVDGILVCEGLEKMRRTILGIAAAIDAGDRQLAQRVDASHQRMMMFRSSLAGA